jgi:hypothetical protein
MASAVSTSEGVDDMAYRRDSGAATSATIGGLESLREQRQPIDMIPPCEPTGRHRA